MDNERETQLFKQMTSEGFKTIFVEYSGSGDEGSIQDAYADDGVRLPPALALLAKELSYEAVGRLHSSWEDGDGGCGTVAFILYDEEIRGARITVDHHQNVTETEVTLTTAWPHIQDETSVTVDGRAFTFRSIKRFGRRILPSEIKEAMAALGIVSVDLLYNTAGEDLNFEQVSITVIRPGQDVETLTSFFDVPARIGLAGMIYPLGAYLQEMFKMALWHNLTEQRGDSWWRNPRDKGEASFVLTNNNLAGHVRHECYEYQKADEKNFYLDSPARAA